MVILDGNLPDGNGFDLCEEIKERRSDTAVIFLTGNDMLKGFELGADDYATKPFSFSVFRKKVSALLGRIRGKMEKDGLQYIKTVYGMGYMWIGRYDSGICQGCLNSVHISCQQKYNRR